MTNDLLQTYDILEQIGSGSGGVIYKAYHKRLKKTVVLKRLIDADGTMARKRQEVDILKDINHSYLPQVLDFFDTEEGVFTVMNYIPGRSFQQVLRDKVRFSKEDLLKWALQICSALNYLHTREIPIIHGDIKPSNIMLKPDGDICLIDFNISFYLNHNTVLGYTKGYSSPEQYWAVSSRQKRRNMPFIIDNKADIYSVGATLYYMATGIIRTDYNSEIDLESLTAFVGPRFAAIIEKAMSADPRKRYQSAYEMYQALSRVPEQSQSDLQVQRKSRGRTAKAVLVAVLILCLGAGAVFAVQKHKDDRYSEAVNTAKAKVIAGKLDQAEEASQEAISLKDDKAEGYYWRDYIFYARGDYDYCRSLASEDLQKVDTESRYLDDQKSIMDLYWLKAASEMEEGKNKLAVNTFEEADRQAGALMRAEHLRDYAVALARVGRTNAAKKQIKQAEEKAKDGQGEIPQYAILYTEGEIQEQDGNDDAALKKYWKVAHKLKEVKGDPEKEYMLNRTYNAIYRIEEERGDYSSCIDAMEEADDKLDGTVWQPEIWRKLGLSYSRVGSPVTAGEWYQKAATSSAGTWNDWHNASTAYYNGNDLAGLEELTEAYIDQTHAHDYGYWHLMAVKEAVRQNLRPDGTADYSQFEDYYHEARAAASNQYQDDVKVLDDIWRSIQQKRQETLGEAGR